MTGELVLHRDDPRIVVVELRGEHDDYTARKLEESLQRTVAGGEHLIVDLRETIFLDSTCAAALISANTRADEAGLGFAVVVNQTTGWATRRLFEVAQLASILPVVPTLGAAIARMRFLESGWPPPDRRSRERRSGRERRVAAGARPSDRRSGAERRSGGDRRRS